jgi:hypothetical protein
MKIIFGVWGQDAALDFGAPRRKSINNNTIII